VADRVAEGSGRTGEKERVMHIRPRHCLIFSGVMLLFISGCDCGGSNMSLRVASIGKYYIGTESEAPRQDAFLDVPPGEIPGSSELSVDHGVVETGTVSMRYLFLKNTGNAALNIVGVQWEGEGHDSFEIACQEGSGFDGICEYSESNYLGIQPDSNFVILIRYAPKAVANHQASFVVKSNAKDNGTLKINLSGVGARRELVVCISDCSGDQSSAECQNAEKRCTDANPKLTVDFGGVNIAGTVRREMWVRNLGELDLVIRSLSILRGDYNQFQVADAQGLPGPLVSGEERKLVLVYQPLYGGAHSSDLHLLSNDSLESDMRVHLRGDGLAPRVCPDPMLLDFGNVIVGESKDLPFVIKNCGTENLSLTNVLLTQESLGLFSLLSQPGYPCSIAPNDLASFVVRYSPSEYRLDHGGVEVFSNDPSQQPGLPTGTIPLVGRGIIRECDLQTTPYSVNFGGVLINTPETVRLVVSNHGNDTCIIGHMGITQNSAQNEFSILSAPADGTTLEPGDIAGVEIQYLPINISVDTGVLALQSNDRDMPQKNVDLNAEGLAAVECDLKVSPPVLRFGTVKLNNAKAMTLTLTNNGYGPCNISAPQIFKSMLTQGDFQITRGPTASFVLSRRGQPNDRQEIEVTFGPKSVDSHSAVLWMHTADDPDFVVKGDGFCFKPTLPPVYPALGDACISLSGMSAESNIEVVPNELNFGQVTVGCNSPEISVTVYNLGSAEINIKSISLADPADPNFEIRYAPRCPYVLSGGSHIEIKLGYHPQDTNNHRGTLFIESDASNVSLLSVPLQGSGTNISEQTDTFDQPANVRSDVLFVVDNSGSMGWAQAALAQNFGNFIRWASNLQVDFQIGVIATEVNDTENGIGDPPRDVEPGVLMEVPSRPKIFNNQTSDLQAAFTEAVAVGTCCSDEQEAGLQAAWMALTPPLIDDPGKNGGFLRKDAKLYVVILSDEQDQSKGETDFYVDFFRGLKGPRNATMVKVSAICGNSPDGCSTSDGGAESGSRYIEVAQRTGGIFESICTSDWSRSLEHLGIDAFTPIREFTLSRQPVENTLVVTVNGQNVQKASGPGGADGWTYYLDSNTLYFGDNVLPGKGAHIVVQYTAACL
jgi:hypothetical protein